MKYMILFIMHYKLVKKMNMAFVYDTKFIIQVLITTLIVSAVSNILYKLTILRYLIIFIYCCILFYIGYRNKKILLRFASKKKQT